MSEARPTWSGGSAGATAARVALGVAALTAACALLAGGCGTTSSAPPAALNATDAAPGPYVLGQGDVVGIIVRNDENAGGDFAIGPEGVFFHPYIGDVRAAGLTKAELQATLTKELSRFINEPGVIVGIVTYRAQRVYVVGEVRQPGEVMLSKPMTLLEVVNAAGGFTEWANRSRVLVRRSGVETPYLVDLKRVEAGKAADDFVVRADDQVTVRRRPPF